jgi:hypothetical protein
VRPSGYQANTGKYTTTKTTFSSIPVRTMKVDSGNDTKSGGSIMIYATGDGDEYEAELVEGKSYGGENLLSNDRRRNKVLACANRRKKNRTVSRPSLAASLVASNKTTPEPNRAASTNPFDDEVPFDESRHDEVMGTNPFADDASSAYPIAGRTANPFD